MQSDAFVQYNLEFNCRCYSSLFFSEDIFQFKSVQEESVISTIVSFLWINLFFIDEKV